MYCYRGYGWECNTWWLRGEVCAKAGIHAISNFFGSVVLEPSDFFSLLVRRREGLMAVT